MINNNIKSDIETEFEKSELIRTFEQSYTGVEVMFTSASGFTMEEIKKIDRILRKHNRKIITIGTNNLKTMWFQVQVIKDE